MQFKMLEHWHQISFSKPFDEYRYKIFSGINSLLMFMHLCGRKDVESMLVSQLQPVLKPAFRKDFVLALDDLRVRKNVLQMYRLLQILGSSTDYSTFYGKAFVGLLQFVGGITGPLLSLPETVLINLMHDIPVCRDVGKLSSVEKHDHGKVVSLVASIILIAGHPMPRYDLSFERNKYCDAAVFLSSRLRYLIDLEHLTTEQELAFWSETPVVGITSLLEFASDTNLSFILPNIGLPKIYPNNVFDPMFDSSHRDGVLSTSTTPTAPPVLNATSVSETVAARPLAMSNDDDNKRVLVLQKSVRIQELRILLTSLGLSALGKKKELQERLVVHGGYKCEFIKPSLNLKRKRTSSSDDDDSD